MEQVFPPINFAKWLQQHEQQLKPPVCNKMIFQEQGFVIMAVGGPNSRKDYHVDAGPEYFYQIKGDMLLKIMQQGKVVDINIKEGEMFLLPPNIPHSPQRFVDTVGIVIERTRLPHEKDGLQWYCDKCNNLLFEEFFTLKNIEKDLPIVFNKFFSSEENRTCKKCKFVMPKQ